MAKDFGKLAAEILQKVGGEENIVSLIHCTTRLRFHLKDGALADKDALNQTEGVISVIESGGQFQVVIGNNVSKVYAEIAKIANIAENAGEEPKGSLMNRAIDFISSVFQPVIGVMAGSGLLKGLVAILSVSGLLAPDSGTYLVLDAVGSGIFYFLPVLLAATTARKLNTNIYIAMAVAFTLVYPSIVDAAGKPLDFIGIPLSLMTYTYSVIPILIAIWLQSYVLRFFENVIHESIRTFFAPAFTLLVVVPVTLLVVGPIGNGIGNALAMAMSWLYDSSALATGFVFGAIWQVLVIFGVHWSFAPVFINNMSVVGYDVLAPITSAAVLGQAGATVAVFLKSHDKNTKAMAGSTSFSGILGITEPLIYGITLRFKKPFIMGCIGGAVGGAIIAVGGAKMFSFGFGGLLGVPVMIGEGSSLSALFLGMGVAFAIALILTYLFGFSDDMLAPAATPAPVNPVPPQVKSSIGQINLVSPLEGKVIPLVDTPDQMFASEVLGKGVAVEPGKGELVSPVNGTVSSVFPTKHAVNLVSEEGAEILMHIGMDTVKLGGKHFESFVKDGDKVITGQPLIRFDIAAIKAAGYPIVTPIIIANTEDYLDVIPTQEEYIQQGEPLISVVLNKQN